MLSALIYAEEDGKRENERRVAEAAARGCETEAGAERHIGEREVGERERKREDGRKTDREDHRSCRIRSHVIGIVDSVLRRSLSSPASVLRFESHPCPPNPCPSPALSLSLSPLLFVSATHTRSRGYVVEPPRGHRIIIGWQVTRTLSPGFNWPIIVARIDGAAGPDRRETFGVACSPSDTTRLSVTNISWQEGANARADRGGPRERRRGWERVGGREGTGGAWASRREDRGGRYRRYVCEHRARGTRTCVFVCGGRVESGSESGARTGANWSRLVCPISVPSHPATPPPLVPRPARPLDRSINPSRRRIPPPCSMSISPTS